MKIFLLYLLLSFVPIVANSQTKYSIVTLKNGTILNGVIKSIDPTNALTIEIAGIETTIKMADVAKIEEEKVINQASINLPNSDTIEDENIDKTNQSFIGESGGDRFCLKLLGHLQNPVLKN